MTTKRMNYWTKGQLRTLKRSKGRKLGAVAKLLKRTPSATYQKARAIGVQLSGITL